MEYTADQIENIVAYSKAKKAHRKAVAKVARLETYQKMERQTAEAKAHLTLARCEEKRAWSRLIAEMGACPSEVWENPELVLKATGHGPVKVDRTALNLQEGVEEYDLSEEVERTAPENFPYEEDDLSGEYDLS